MRQKMRVLGLGRVLEVVACDDWSLVDLDNLIFGREDFLFP